MKIWKNYKSSDIHINEIIFQYDYNINWFRKAAFLNKCLHYFLQITLICCSLLIVIMGIFEVKSFIIAITGAILTALTSIINMLKPIEKWQQFKNCQITLSNLLNSFILGVEKSTDILEHCNDHSTKLTLFLSNNSNKYFKELNKYKFKNT